MPQFHTRLALASESMSPADSARKQGVIIFLFVLVGVFLLLMAARGYAINQIDARSESWPAATGEVLNASVAPVTRQTLHVRENSLRRTITVYTCRVRYRYDVDGRQYESTRLMASGRPIDHRTNEQAERWMASYTPGSSISVYYDPSNPSMSTLVRGSAPGAWRNLIGFGVGGIACILVGGGLFYRMRARA